MNSATTARVVFKVYAANVITSMRIEATGLCTTREDSLRICVSRDAGLHWRPVWNAAGTGSIWGAKTGSPARE